MATQTGSLWLAILITVVASTACSIGKALQKEATRHLPRLSTESKILRQYVQSRAWVIGVAADLGGGVIQIAAFALAPVSVVQPISSIGLAGLALYSHFVLRERLSQWEWWAVGVAGVGTLGLGASSGSEPEPTGEDGQALAGPLRMVTTLMLSAVAVASLTMVRQRQQQRHRKSGGDKTSAALYGLQAGGCFGLSAASCRIGFLMAGRQTWLWAPVGLACSIGLSSAGFILQTCGLKEGSAVVVVTCVAVSSMAAGVLVGLIGLGEPLPTTASALFIRLFSSILILLGVVALANGQSGSKELIAAALSHIPASVWSALPVSLAVKLKSWATYRGELPQHHPHSQQDGGASIGNN